MSKENKNKANFFSFYLIGNFYITGPVGPLRDCSGRIRLGRHCGAKALGKPRSWFGLVFLRWVIGILHRDAEHRCLCAFILGNEDYFSSVEVPPELSKCKGLGHEISSFSAIPTSATAKSGSTRARANRPECQEISLVKPSTRTRKLQWQRGNRV